MKSLRYVVTFSILFISFSQVNATEYSAPSAIKELRSCIDGSDFLHVIELENGFKVYNYQFASTQNEATHRKNNFAILLGAYLAQSKVVLGRYNSGITKCGIQGLGELGEVITNTSY